MAFAHKICITGYETCYCFHGNGGSRVPFDCWINKQERLKKKNRRFLPFERHEIFHRSATIFLFSSLSFFHSDQSDCTPLTLLRGTRDIGICLRNNSQLPKRNETRRTDTVAKRHRYSTSLIPLSEHGLTPEGILRSDTGTPLSRIPTFVLDDGTYVKAGSCVSYSITVQDDCE